MAMPLKTRATSSRISNGTQWARRGGRRSTPSLPSPIFARWSFRGFAPTSRRILIRPLQLKDFLISEIKSHQVYPPGECICRDGADPHTNPCIPPARDIYSWSRLTPLDAVKVVVIGQARASSLAFRNSNSPLTAHQDPYHDVGQAHGQSPTHTRATSPRIDSVSQDSHSPSCHLRNRPDRSRTSINSSRATSLASPLPK